MPSLSVNVPLNVISGCNTTGKTVSSVTDVLIACAPNPLPARGVTIRSREDIGYTINRAKPDESVMALSAKETLSEYPGNHSKISLPCWKKDTVAPTTGLSETSNTVTSKKRFWNTIVSPILSPVKTRLPNGKELTLRVSGTFAPGADPTARMNIP